MPRTRDRAVTVVLDPDHRLLVIGRFKDGRCYYVSPGGAVEPNEQPAEIRPLLVALEHDG